MPHRSGGIANDAALKRLLSRHKAQVKPCGGALKLLANTPGRARWCGRKRGVCGVLAISPAAQRAHHAVACVVQRAACGRRVTLHNGVIVAAAAGRLLITRDRLWRCPAGAHRSRSRSYARIFSTSTSPSLGRAGRGAGHAVGAGAGGRQWHGGSAGHSHPSSSEPAPWNAARGPNTSCGAKHSSQRRGGRLRGLRTQQGARAAAAPGALMMPHGAKNVSLGQEGAPPLAGAAVQSQTGRR